MKKLNLRLIMHISQGDIASVDTAFKFNYILHQYVLYYQIC